ncbi:MAG: hypothetical protein U0P81_00830 [Holophagaceae bacterium]
MLTPCLALAALIAAAPPAGHPRKPPMIPCTLEASVAFGPGREPLPGTPPFQPKLEATLAFQGAAPREAAFRLWLIPASTPASTRPSAARKRRALALETLSRDEKGAVLRAPWPRDLAAEGWHAAVECLVGGTVRGAARTAVKALYLPAAPPRGRDAEN